ncbi:MAG TPA: IPT/TIG domain-containing protein [Pyrinomonadaceae bacterium]|nr:IPT/TIG domain-containing protein [Pyrinomonadaceae bacterium]
MGLVEGKTTAERNKTIAALALGLVALVVVARMLFGGGSTTTTTTRTTRNANSNARQPAGAANATANDAPLYVPREILYEPRSPGVPTVGRNIFAFYIAPTPAPKPVVIPSTPEPTPTPTPPLLISNVTPPNVYARTGDFTLQISGDKFTPQVRVFFNLQELPTRFVGPQQLTAQVPAQLIANPGPAQIVVRTPDGVLFSNIGLVNIAQPPMPDLQFVGVLIRPRGNDTAMLKDRKGELHNVQRGDLVGGRFRVTSIAAARVELTDSQLKIKHTIPFSEQRGGPGGQPPRPPTPPPTRGDEDDSEP